jgi:hypothetical protein
MYKKTTMPLFNKEHCRKEKAVSRISEKLSDRFWAPPHIGLPVGAGLPSLPRVDPVPKNLLFSEDGPDGCVRHFSTDPR